VGPRFSPKNVRHILEFSAPTGCNTRGPDSCAQVTGVGDARGEPGQGFFGQLPLADPRTQRRARRRGGRPGRCRPGRGSARATRPHARGHPRHPPPSRPRRGRPGTGARHGVEVYGPSRERHALRGTTARRRGHREPCRSRPRISRDGGARPHPRPRRLLRPRRAVLRRHAVQRRLRPPLRGHARADARLARPHRRAARRHAGLLRPRVHAVEPALRRDGPSPAMPTCSRRSSSARAARPRRHHAAHDARRERRINPSCAAGSPRSVPRPRLARALPCPARWTCSP